MYKLLNTDIESVLDLQSQSDIQALLVVFLIILVVMLILSLLITGSTYKMFTKAGVEGWKAFIPIYSTYIRIEIAYGVGKTWLMTGFLASIASIFIADPLLSPLLSVIGSIFSIYITYGFLRRFTDKGLAIAGTIFTLPIYPIIAFNKKYTYKALYEDDEVEYYDDEFNDYE